jgi:ferredoxin--NADP+ reductase
MSPVALLGDAVGSVRAIRLVKNRLSATDTGSLLAKPTGELEDLPAGLVFRSVGYRGLPLADVPFQDATGVVPNVRCRVVDPTTPQPRVGEYVAGWIKRGPTGVIGTNKPDSVETVACMMEDLGLGRVLAPAAPGAEAVEQLVRERQIECVSYGDWRRLDELEIARGRPLGRPRVKFTRIKDMLAALGR